MKKILLLTSAILLEIFSVHQANGMWLHFARQAGARGSRNLAKNASMRRYLTHSTCPSSVLTRFPSCSQKDQRYCSSQQPISGSTENSHFAQNYDSSTLDAALNELNQQTTTFKETFAGVHFNSECLNDWKDKAIESVTTNLEKLLYSTL